jgi:hypothetical protein
MRVRRLLIILLCALGSVAWADNVSFSLGEADVFLKNDRLDDRSTVTDYFSFSMNRAPAAGDFDGDGVADLAVPLLGSASMEVDIIPGGAVASGILSGAARWRIVVPASPGYQTTHNLIAFGDMNGDGRDDVAVRSSDSVHVFYGRTAAAGVAELGAGDSDLSFRHVNCQSLAVADVTGDGLADLLFVARTISSDQLMVEDGERTSAARSVDLTAGGAPDHTVALQTSLSPFLLSAADIDGDGVLDILATRRSYLTNTSVVYAFRGNVSFPVSANLSSFPPFLTFINQSGLGFDLGFDFLGAEDLDGDGRADVMIAKGSGQLRELRLYRGSALANVSSVNINNASVPSQVFLADTVPLDGVAEGDFDGDGQSDVALSNASSVRLFLSSQGSFSNLAAGGALSPAVTVNGAHAGIALADFDADGKRDLAALDVLGFPGSTASTYSNLYVFRGFHPLSRPAVRLGARADSTSRVTLDLSVDGEPREMRFTGDLLDPPPGVWVPFANRARVTLTPTSAGKNVSVVFRARPGRESAAVAVSLSLTPTDGLRAVTNRVRPGEPMRLECQRPQGGRVSAVVRHVRGARVRTLADGDATPGVVVLEWDGRDESGRAVSPGFYVVTVEWAGGRERRRVLVEP